MRKSILMLAFFLLILTLLILHLHTYNSPDNLLHYKQKGKDFERINLKQYKEYVYANGGYEPLTIIWWQEMVYPFRQVDRPFKKFWVTSDLRTIMKELDELSHDKKTQSMMPAQYEKNTLRIYLSSETQKQFLILEIEFALDDTTKEFVCNYGRSAKLCELLSSKEKSEHFWSSPWEDRVDSNEYKEHLIKMRELVKSRREDPNRYEPNQ